MNHDDVRALFSEAYDDELSAPAGTEFEKHLSMCTPCNAAYAEYKRGLDLVRGLPMATMPNAVELPTTPIRGKGMLWLPGAVGKRLASGRGLATLGGLAAAAVLLGVVQLHPGSAPSSGASALRIATPSASSLSALSKAQNLQAPFAANAAGADSVAAAGCSTTLLTSPGATPAGAASAQSSSGKAQITITSNAASVSAGQSIVVYARATVPLTSVAAPHSTPSPPLTVGPCVTLFAQSPRATGSPASQSQLQAQSAVPRSVDNLGAVTITIPADVKPGDQIVLTASVPAEAGGIAAVPALQVTLTLTVR